MQSHKREQRRQFGIGPADRRRCRVLLQVLRFLAAVVKSRPSVRYLIISQTASNVPTVTVAMAVIARKADPSALSQPLSYRGRPWVKMSKKIGWLH